MQNHVVLCGYGRNGQQVIRELKAHNHQFVIIDQNHDIFLKNIEKSGGFIEGDATQDEVLLKANIKTARALITTLPEDADNLYVVLTARSLNPNLDIISRASNQTSEKKLRMAGVDNVVIPEGVGGAHMANIVTNPDIIEFMDHVSVHGDDPTSLEEFECPEVKEGEHVKTIGEYAIRRRTGANIIGYKSVEGDYILNPKPDTKLLPGTKLFVLGTPDQITQMEQILMGKNG
jgi:voltage-gated potassium channel